MKVAEAQREVRTVYMGGFVGQLVSGVLWLASAAIAQWYQPKIGFWFLALGGALIFPITQGVLRAMGRPASLSPENPLRWLAMQIAFTVPLVLPVVGGATMHRLGWFYPGCMIVVGAHYLPFIFLYGMPLFGVLGAILVGAGVAIGMRAPEQVTLGGWLTGVVLVAFAPVLRYAATRQDSALAPHE